MRFARAAIAALTLASCARPQEAGQHDWDAGRDVHADASSDEDAGGYADEDAGSELEGQPMWKRRDVQAAILIALGAVAVTRMSTGPEMVEVPDQSGYVGIVHAPACDSCTPKQTRAVSFACTDGPAAGLPTYSLAKTSGPGTCSFFQSDGTTPLTFPTSQTSAKWSCTTAGSITIRATCTDGDRSDFDDFTFTNTSITAQLPDLYLYEVADPGTEIISGAVQSLQDLSAHNLDLAALSSAERPVYFAQGGPENGPAIYLDHSSNSLALSAALSVAAGARYTVYLLATNANHVGERYTGGLYGSTFTAPTAALGINGNSPADAWRMRGRRVDATVSDINVATDWQWHLFSIEPLSTGWTGRRDDVAFSPDFTLGTTAQYSFGSVAIGAGPSFASTYRSHGRVAMFAFGVDFDATDDANFRAYAAYKWPGVGATRTGAAYVAGQSNAFNSTDEARINCGWIDNTYWATPPAAISQGSTSLFVDWAPGSTLRTNLITTVSTAPAGPVYILWSQGETDCANSTWAAAYAANFVTNPNSLMAQVAATGRNVYWIISLLHQSGTGCTNPTAMANVNSGLILGATTYGDHATTLDPTAYGSLQDSVHWDPALQQTMACTAARRIEAFAQ